MPPGRLQLWPIASAPGPRRGRLQLPPVTSTAPHAPPQHHPPPPGRAGPLEVRRRRRSVASWGGPAGRAPVLEHRTAPPRAGFGGYRGPGRAPIGHPARSYDAEFGPAGPSGPVGPVSAAAGAGGLGWALDGPAVASLLVGAGSCAHDRPPPNFYPARFSRIRRALADRHGIGRVTPVCSRSMPAFCASHILGGAAFCYTPPSVELQMGVTPYCWGCTPPRGG